MFTDPDGIQPGSSPRIRGTLYTFYSPLVYLRFIPVHTGNTITTCHWVWLVTVHPRAYGEHPFILFMIITTIGSSPCIRGTQNQFKCFHGNNRFIPVHTGNTEFSLTYSRSITVHPRAYGEHRYRCFKEFPLFGSSPCIRGTHLLIILDLRNTRFIPVHTGNTLIIID